MPQSLALLEPKGVPAPGTPGSNLPGAGPRGGFQPFGNDGLTFDDVLDVINPLHHLPVVGFLYRAVTGDTISPASRITGGALFGGPIGLAASVADTVLKEASGRDVGGHIMALVGANEDTNPLPKFEIDHGSDAEWDKANSLRYDSNEFEDWRPLAHHDSPVRTAAAASAAQAGKAPSGTSPNRKDGEPAATENAPAPKPSQNTAAAPGPLAPLAPAAAETASPPAAGQAANQAAIHAAGAQPGLATKLPSAKVLAANPAMVTAMRKGDSPYFRPGGTLNSDTWLKLMNTAGGTRKPGTAPTGPGGLSSAAIAKALATYGAAAKPTIAPAEK